MSERIHNNKNDEEVFDLNIFDEPEIKDSEESESYEEKLSLKDFFENNPQINLPSGYYVFFISENGDIEALLLDEKFNLIGKKDYRLHEADIFFDFNNKLVYINHQSDDLKFSNIDYPNMSIFSGSSEDFSSRPPPGHTGRWLVNIEPMLIKNIYQGKKSLFKVFY